jgi:23S rRNA-/tRNA-specific pseudouridylate synthase
MSAPDLRIIDRRAGWVAVDKPAGIPTEPAPGFDEHLVGRVAQALRVAPESLHPVNRLDVPVSGVIALATEPAARREAGRLVAEHRIHRRYLGLLAGALPTPTGCLDGAIGRGSRGWVVGGRGARPARTGYATVALTDAAALLALSPRTGRTHQIRVHCAHAGRPLLFDRRYGGASRLVLADGRVLSLGRVALHAARFELPLAGGSWVVEAAVPEELVALWEALGGRESAFGEALEAALPPCHLSGRTP